MINIQDEGSIHTHFHSCLKYKRTSVTRRHDELCRYITTKCQQLGFIASCTVKRSDPDDPVKSKIRDGSQTSLNGNTTFTDVTFRNTDSYILQARSNPGSVLDTAEASKHKKYKSYCNTLDATFAALACSVSGMIGAEFQEFLFYMANHALSSPIVQHIQNKIERANLLKRLKHEIAILIQKGNAHVDIVGVAEAQAMVCSTATWKGTRLTTTPLQNCEQEITLYSTLKTCLGRESSSLKRPSVKRNTLNNHHTLPHKLARPRPPPKRATALQSRLHHTQTIHLAGTTRNMSYGAHITPTKPAKVTLALSICLLRRIFV